MADAIITCTQARAQGLNYYFTGKPCKRGHVAKRRVVNRSCVECLREDGRRRYRRPDVRERQKQYREEHKERRRVLIESWRKANPDKVKEKYARWYQANIEEARRSARKRKRRRYSECDTARSGMLASNSAHRARRAGCEGSHTKRDLRKIFAAQRGCCAYCRADLRKVKRHLDHIVPLAKGGTDYPNNLQWLCEPCNRSKHAKDPTDFARERGLLI